MREQDINKTSAEVSSLRRLRRLCASAVLTPVIVRISARGHDEAIKAFNLLIQLHTAIIRLMRVIRVLFPKSKSSGANASAALAIERGVMVSYPISSASIINLHFKAISPEDE